MFYLGSFVNIMILYLLKRDQLSVELLRLSTSTVEEK